MKYLKVRKDKVIEAHAKMPEFAKLLEGLFPEVFVEQQNKEGDEKEKN